MSANLNTSFDTSTLVNYYYSIDDCYSYYGVADVRVAHASFNLNKEFFTQMQGLHKHIRVFLHSPSLALYRYFI